MKDSLRRVPGAPPTTYLAPTAAGLDQIAALPGVSPFVINLMRNNLQLPTTQDSTFDVLGTPVPFGSVTLAVPGSQSGHSFQINVDHIPNASNQIRYRFGYDRQRLIQAGGGGEQFNNFVALDSRLFSATWIRTINSNLVNDLRFSYRRAIDDRPLQDPAVTDFPNITINDLNLAWGPDPNLPQGTPVDNNYQLYDAVTIIQGNHAIKVGGEFRDLIYTSSFLPRARGDYFYSFDQLIQDLAPLPGDGIRGVGSPGFTGNRNQWFVFGQDDWKVRPNLTLNLGLRYEYSTLPRDAAAQALNNIASVPGVIEFNVPKTDKNNFAPRLGFAWSPTFKSGVGKFIFGDEGDSAIRANFAISHFVNFQNLLPAKSASSICARDRWRRFGYCVSAERRNSEHSSAGGQRRKRLVLQPARSSWTR
jgi:outer membrane receptor protein involved in Fe transport